MNKRKSYHTKQKALILDCLRAYMGRHATAERIGQYLREKGAPVGVTTLYRNLDHLVESGAVLKYIMPKGAGACYQLLGQPVDYSKYHYLICIACGRVIPLHCSYFEGVRTYIRDKYRFILGCSKTILYGYCGDCASEENGP